MKKSYEKKKFEIKLSEKLIDGTTNLSWNEVEDAKGYEVWASFKNKEFKIIYYGVGLKFIHYTAVPALRYSYYIRAVDACSNVLCNSNIVTITSGIAVPRIRVNNTRKGNILIKWTPVVGAKKYEVYRKSSDTVNQVIGTTKLDEFTDSEIVSGTEYEYSVVAIGKKKESLPSTSLKISGMYKATRFTVAISKKGFPLLRWDMPEGGFACHIYRTEDQNDDPIEIAVRSDSNSYINTNTKKGTTYYYTVRIEYNDGNLSFPAKIREIRVPEYIDDFFDFKIDITKARKLRLSWNIIEDAMTYQVFASYIFSSNEYEKIFETENNFYINSLYKFDKVRYYRIRAIHKDGLKGKFSKIIKVDPENIAR